jgi:hypothetical protein
VWDDHPCREKTVSSRRGQKGRKKKDRTCVRTFIVGNLKLFRPERIERSLSPLAGEPTSGRRGVLLGGWSPPAFVGFQSLDVDFRYCSLEFRRMGTAI